MTRPDGTYAFSTAPAPLPARTAEQVTADIAGMWAALAHAAEAAS
jgi:hypothetical protein